MLQQAPIQPISNDLTDTAWTVSDNLKQTKILHAPFEIAGNMAKICGFLRRNGVQATSADIELRIPCVDKAKDVLGFKAKVDLEEGILMTAEYYMRMAKGMAA